ncbi:MAG: hypothetical protein KKI09_01850, partial [Spirochaetes bacterium]|nr:hypothetical protein [Spirochaetota bacterium]
GAIEVSAANTKGQVLIAIQDDGVGLPENVSLHDSPGFGLQLVLALAEQMAAAVRLEQSAGAGTRIVLVFAE